MKNHCKTSRLYIPYRWIIITLCFLTLLNGFAMKFCLAIAIVEMTTSPLRTNQLSNNMPFDKVDIIEIEDQMMVSEEIFDWSEQTQGIILSSFFWGYLTTNVAGGMISDKIGGRYILEFSIYCTSIITILTPVTVQWGGSTALILVRVLLGLAEGFMLPAVNVIIVKWFPENELSCAVSWALSGSLFGGLAGKAVAGAIIQYLNSWASVFYCFGGFGLFSSMLVRAFCFERPRDSPFISDSERIYIEENIKQISAETLTTPWRHILQSKPVWALLITNFAMNYSFMPITLTMPKYMKNVLDYPVHHVGYLLSITSVTTLLINFVGSWSTNKAIIGGLMTKLLVRKLGCTIATTGCGLLFLAIPYAGQNGALVVTLYITGVSLHMFQIFTLMINPLDLAPNYVGTLMGFANGAATLGAFVSPYVVGTMTPNQTIDEWKLVYWIHLVIFIFSNLVFMSFGRANIQDWNDPDFLGDTERKTNTSGTKEVLELQ